MLQQLLAAFVHAALKGPHARPRRAAANENLTMPHYKEIWRAHSHTRSGKSIIAYESLWRITALLSFDNVPSHTGVIKIE